MSDSVIKEALKKHIGVNHEWLALRKEDIVDPDLRMIDPHHHIWDNPGSRYLFDDYLADVNSGHNLAASVHVQCHSMYRSSGPEEMRCVGETEFVNGVAAQSASGGYGDFRMCAGIIGTVDLLSGGRVEPVLEAHIAAGGGRFRGIRPTVAWHESSEVRALDIQPHILMESSSREAIALIDRFGLTFDIWAFFTQLDETLDVARSFPDLPVIVNHIGGPVGIGPYEGKREEVFRQWAQNMQALSELPNVSVKLGGLAMRYGGFAFNKLPLPPGSDELAQKWKPYVEKTIDLFGPERCMFASNFPVDRAMCSYHILWNAYKKMTKDFSVTEKNSLFFDTAKNTYKLECSIR